MGNIIRRCLGKGKRIIKIKQAEIKLKNASSWKHLKTKKMKVGFIVQMTEIWDKQEPVFEYMKQNPNIDTSLIVVPPYDFENNAVTKDYSDNYFINNYPDDCIKAFNADGSLIKIQDYEFDYIFFSRPYDSYLPDGLRSSCVARYAKCCYIPYGYSGSDNFNSMITDVSFFGNMYFIFPESPYMESVFLNYKCYKKNSEKSIQKIKCLGYPSLAQFLKAELGETEKTVLWTPRWSYAPKIGGSHFIEFKDEFLELTEKYPDYKFIFRPHPLMFQELIKTGKMTKSQVDEFLEKLKSSSVIYDKGTPIYESIAKSAIIISDYSSIVINMALAEKPVIYFPGEVYSNGDYKQLSDGFYVVNSTQELVTAFEKLISGDDSLKEKRKQIKEKYADLHLNSAEKISCAIIDDFNKNVKL